jgi:hypothetical protein
MARSGRLAREAPAARSLSPPAGGSRTVAASNDTVQRASASFSPQALARPYPRRTSRRRLSALEKISPTPTSLDPMRW